MLQRKLSLSETLVRMGDAGLCLPAHLVGEDLKLPWEFPYEMGVAVERERSDGEEELLGGVSVKGIYAAAGEVACFKLIHPPPNQVVRPKQKKQQQQQQQQRGSGSVWGRPTKPNWLVHNHNRALHHTLNVKRASAGTGVFLPRHYDTPLNKTAKPFNFNTSTQHRFSNAFPINYDSILARRNALLMQHHTFNLPPQDPPSSEIRLPQDWTY